MLESLDICWSNKREYDSSQRRSLYCMQMSEEELAEQMKGRVKYGEFVLIVEVDQ